jgi:hypothetical protein
MRREHREGHSRRVCRSDGRWRVPPAIPDRRAFLSARRPSENIRCGVPPRRSASRCEKNARDIVQRCLAAEAHRMACGHAARSATRVGATEAISHRCVRAAAGLTGACVNNVQRELCALFPSDAPNWCEVKTEVISGVLRGAIIAAGTARKADFRGDRAVATTQGRIVVASTVAGALRRARCPALVAPQSPTVI